MYRIKYEKKKNQNRVHHSDKRNYFNVVQQF